MRMLLAATAAMMMMAGTGVAAAPCKDAKGKFVKCPEKASPKPTRCKDARGKFVKCGTTGARPA